MKLTMSPQELTTLVFNYSDNNVDTITISNIKIDGNIYDIIFERANPNNPVFKKMWDNPVFVAQDGGVKS